MYLETCHIKKNTKYYIIMIKMQYYIRNIYEDSLKLGFKE